MRDIIVKVNNNCMLRCPYCFAHNEKHSELSIKDMQKLLKFCERNNLENVKLTGGEPFLYSHIVIPDSSAYAKLYINVLY